MKVTQMPPVHAANLVANSGNTAYGVDVIMFIHVVWRTYWEEIVVIATFVFLLKSVNIENMFYPQRKSLRGKTLS